METLEGLRARIATTESLQSVVGTMKSLAVVGIRQCERAVDALAEYTRTIDLGIQVALRATSEPARPPEKPSGREAMVVFGSDHGLCGRFNDVVVDLAVERARAAGGEAHVLAAGVRAASRLRATGIVPDEVMSLPGGLDGLTTTAREILIRMDRWRMERDVQRVVVLHNLRAEQSTATPIVLRVLPIDPEILRRARERRWPTRCLPLARLEGPRLLSAMLRQRIFISIYRAAAESMASEHASRLASMQAAERNISERLDQMASEYRRRRQESITAEMLDVVSGFEALTARRS